MLDATEASEESSLSASSSESAIAPDVPVVEPRAVYGTSFLWIFLDRFFFLSVWPMLVSLMLLVGLISFNAFFNKFLACEKGFDIVFKGSVVFKSVSQVSQYAHTNVKPHSPTNAKPHSPTTI